MIVSLLTSFYLLGAACTSSVQPVMAQYGCRNINSYYPYTGVTGYFMLTVSGCVNTTAPNQACSIEGFRDTVVYSGGSQGYLAIGYQRDQAIVQIRCSDSSSSVVDACTSFGQRGCNFQTLRVKSDTSSANLMWGLSDEQSTTVEFYHHYVDGKQQDGLFIGSQNETSWAIKQHDTDSGSKVPYWLFRLLGHQQELEEGEMKTFIKMDYP